MIKISHSEISQGQFKSRAAEEAYKAFTLVKNQTDETVWNMSYQKGGEFDLAKGDPDTVTLQGAHCSGVDYMGNQVTGTAHFRDGKPVSAKYIDFPRPIHYSENILIPMGIPTSYGLQRDSQKAVYSYSHLGVGQQYTLENGDLTVKSTYLGVAL